MKTLIVIPARWGSVRLPGKPLMAIAGRSLLHRVIANARQAASEGRAEVVVATDDERILDHSEEVGCSAVLTDPALVSGSDRVLAAADQILSAGDRLVNLQGDAPFISPATIIAVIDTLANMPFGCVTPVVALEWGALDALRERKRAVPFSGTTCVRDSVGRASWFSKAILPMIRDETRLRETSPVSPVYQHLGLYGYTRSALTRFCAAAPTQQERFEGLEQLRLIELGIPIQTVVVSPPEIQMGGIDTPHDILVAEKLIARHGDPYDRQ